jgi:hypothetical protein
MRRIYQKLIWKILNGRVQQPSTSYHCHRHTAKRCVLKAISNKNNRLLGCDTIQFVLLPSSCISFFPPSEDSLFRPFFPTGSHTVKVPTLLSLTMLHTTASLGSCLLPQGSPHHLHTKPHGGISQKTVISILTAVNVKSYQGNRNLKAVKQHIPYIRSAFSYTE